MGLRTAVLIMYLSSALTCGKLQICPDGQPPVQCFANPCSNNPCEAGLNCVPNYCEGCNYDCREPQCPQLKCKPCKHGFVFDKDGCQTCSCKESCGSKPCGADEFCNGEDCCPNWVKFTRCSDPCATLRCDSKTVCQRYCGCLARCT